MAKCNFCNSVVKQGRGKTFVARDGRALNFCSSKCEKNFLLGRNPKRVNWIRKAKKKKAEEKE